MSTSRSKAGRPRSRWVVAGLDIGHGETKWVSEWGQGHHPSVVARETPGIQFEDHLRRGSTEHFIIENGVQRGGQPARFAIGESAYAVGVPVQAIDIGRLEDEEYQVLVNAALVRAVPSSGPVLVVTGLPVDHLGKKEALRKLLAGEEGKRWEVSYQDETFHYDLYPDQVTVLPEGLGGLMSLYLSENGRVDLAWEHLTGQALGVIDVGTYSTDVSTFEPGLNFNRTRTRTYRLGLGTIYDILIRSAAQELGMDIDRRKAEAALKTRRLHVGSREEDVSAWVDGAVADVAAQLIAELRHLWQSGKDVEQVLLLGGGADYVVDALAERFGGTVEVTLLPDAPMANALGYYRYGLFQLAQLRERGAAA